MATGAPLVASTTIAGQKGIFRYRFFRERARRQGMHLFEIPALQASVNEAGFEDFRCWVYGSMVLFRARRRA
jgi:hypothetical protein